MSLKQSEFDLISDDFKIEEAGSHIQENLQDSIVRQALNTGIDLRDYSQQIQSKLELLEKESIENYVNSGDSVANLHQQIMTCDTILERMDKILSNFHRDLGSISSDIQLLQRKSVQMHYRLQNRQVARGELCQFMADMVVPEQLISHILETPVTERQFLEQLHELDHKIRFVKEQSYQESKSCGDVSEILEKLKFKAIGKIREYLLQKIYAFRKPMTNYQIPQNSMLKFRFYNEFLIANERTVAKEIKTEYLETASKVYYSYLRSYSTKLMKLQFDKERVADKDDLLGQEGDNHPAATGASSSSVIGGIGGGGSGSSSSISSNPAAFKSKTPVFSLGQRARVLLAQSELEAPIIIPHAPGLAVASGAGGAGIGGALMTSAQSGAASSDSKNQRTTVKFLFEALFRSLHYAILDNSCREYLFLADFFMLNTGQTLELFNLVMEKSLLSIQKLVVTQITASHDAISLLICIRIAQRYRQLAAARNVPALEQYWTPLLKQLWTRWFHIMEAHLASLRNHATASAPPPPPLNTASNAAASGGAAMFSSLFSSSTGRMLSAPPPDLRPSSVTRRYAEFCSALHTVLRSGWVALPAAPSFSSAGGGVASELSSTAAALPPTVEDQAALDILQQMRNEMEEALQRLSLRLHNSSHQAVGGGGGARSMTSSTAAAVGGGGGGAGGGQRARLVYLINNYDLILTVLQENGVGVGVSTSEASSSGAATNSATAGSAASGAAGGGGAQIVLNNGEGEVSRFRASMEKRIAEFQETALQPYFGSFIQFVKDAEEKQRAASSAAAASSVTASAGEAAEKPHSAGKIVTSTISMTGDELRREETRVQRIIKGFNIDWKNCVDKIHEETMVSFHNLRLGNKIFQGLLSILVQYYQRLQNCMNCVPYRNMPIRNEMINIHNILVEMKKYKRDY